MLDVYGQLQLWSYLATNSSISMAHSFNAYPTNAIQWHSDIAKDGSMLLARYIHNYSVVGGGREGGEKVGDKGWGGGMEGGRE